MDPCFHRGLRRGGGKPGIVIPDAAGDPGPSPVSLSGSRIFADANSGMTLRGMKDVSAMVQALKAGCPLA